MTKLTAKIKSLVVKNKTEHEPFYSKEIYKHKKYVIGDYTYGQFEVLFEDDESNLFIGKFCSIADGLTIMLGGNHRVDWLTTYPFNVRKLEFPEASAIVGHPATKGDVRIGNDVWIGKDVMILSGKTIGDGAVVAARSVVTKDIGPYEIWGGNPAKFIRKRFDEETINKLMKAQWWDWTREEIINKLPVLCNDHSRINEL